MTKYKWCQYSVYAILSTVYKLRMHSILTPILVILLLLTSILLAHHDHSSRVKICKHHHELFEFVSDRNDHHKINFSLQVPDSLPLSPADLKRRNTTIRHLGLFAHTFTDSIHHWLLNLGETCDPATHEAWMSKNYHEFYMTDEWHRKVCTFTRFLHCNNVSKVCECAPTYVYGVAFHPGNSEVSSSPYFHLAQPLTLLSLTEFLPISSRVRYILPKFHVLYKKTNP